MEAPLLVVWDNGLLWSITNHKKCLARPPAKRSESEGERKREAEPLVLDNGYC